MAWINKEADRHEGRGLRLAKAKVKGDEPGVPLQTLQQTPQPKGFRVFYFRAMKIIGTHTIIYSKDAEADRKFFRDILKYRNVDVGGGWLVFALPPGEVAVHPSDENDVHEFYLMCDDVKAFIDKMKKTKVGCSSIHEERWGSLVHITLPGGGKLGIYQPKHPLAIEMS